ncbi:cytochrome P450 [Rhodovarius crocodyli]|uniref:Cytochrome P450 n=1 Tax=Rhodovarius crocodyli TaxID=1979269 RepID=A0A437M3L6_9PROT|nr:cytochrome P450 [Rhodovarius crocodyli]RVT92186.1 cytochrome P450 [Rhodovarius crocodyli]
MTTDTLLEGRPAPVITLDPYDDAILADPFPAYDEIRRAGPAVYLEKHGVYAIGRHRDVMAALKNWRDFSSTGGSGIADIRKPGAWRSPSPIVETDPPDHTRVRGVMNKVLSPSVMRQWRAEFEAEAARLVDEMLERGSFDGVHDLSEAFIARVLPDALGLPDSPERRDNLFLIGEWNFDAQGPRNARLEATTRRVAAIEPWHQEMMKRENQASDGFGLKIFEAADAGEIPAEVAPLLIRSFLRGGLDTSSSTISAALHYLARDPAQYAALRANPDRARNAIEEAMRIETPIPYVGRLTMRDVVVDDVTIPADSKVIVMLPAANRDPDFWANPDEFDIDRKTQGHVALGYGIHMCVGQAVARLEGEVMLKALAARVETLELVGAPERRLNNNLRSFGKLPLRAR